MSFFDKTYTYAYWKPMNQYNIITRSNNGKLYYIYVFTVRFWSTFLFKFEMFISSMWLRIYAITFVMHCRHPICCCENRLNGIQWRIKNHNIDYMVRKKRRYQNFVQTTSLWNNLVLSNKINVKRLGSQIM